MGVTDGGDARESSESSSSLVDSIMLWVLSLGLAALFTGSTLDSRHKKDIASLKAENEALKSEYVLQNRNVVGGDVNDLFYETSFGRAYLAIDGRPVGEYFAR